MSIFEFMLKIENYFSASCEIKYLVVSKKTRFFETKFKVFGDSFTVEYCYDERCFNVINNDSNVVIKYNNLEDILDYIYRYEFGGHR